MRRTQVQVKIDHIYIVDAMKYWKIYIRIVDGSTSAYSLASLLPIGDSD